MPLQAIVDSPELFIGYDVPNDWLYVDWKGEHNQESSQTACLQMLDSLRMRPCHKILNDNSNITRTTVQLTLWSSWWLGEMRAAGLRCIAWVLPQGLLARQSVEAATQVITTPHVSTFDDLASAYVWLQQQQLAPIASEL